MALSRTIVIAGAGIGGLTAALALAARGFRIVVLEKAERLQRAIRPLIPLYGVVTKSAHVLGASSSVF